jgi:benzoyl-CoA-dihydrodiol lyase
VRRDLADVFCSTSEGVRADRARQWKLVDHIAKPQQFVQAATERAAELVRHSNRPGAGTGVALPPLARTVDAAGYHYRMVVAIDHQRPSP